MTDALRTNSFQKYFYETQIIKNPLGKTNISVILNGLFSINKHPLTCQFIKEIKLKITKKKRLKFTAINRSGSSYFSSTRTKEKDFFLTITRVKSFFIFLKKAPINF